MSDEQQNEKVEAERLLSEALEGVDLDVDGGICPQGDACAVHHRNDEEIIDDETEYGRLINYVGEWAVITTDNPELESPVTLLKLVLGQIALDNLPPVYETCVVHVGSEGTLSDMRKLSDEDRRQAIRFIQKHDDWANFKEAHAAVLSGVKEGLLDLSGSAFKEED